MISRLAYLDALATHELPVRLVFTLFSMRLLTHCALSVCVVHFSGHLGYHTNFIASAYDMLCVRWPL